MSERYITMAHGGGGIRMQELLRETVFPLMDESVLFEGEDAASLSLPPGKVAFTTDSFVVKPLFFPGGDIGKLAVCGTVNDLAMRGAKPLYLALGLILEEGLSFDVLEKVLSSVAGWAAEAGVRVVAGDTKVVERGMADGMYINTSGLGVTGEGREVSIKGAAPRDVLLVNGYIGDHGMAVLSDRENLSFESGLQSDCAPLGDLVASMLDAGRVHALRDPTRGGLAAALKEMAAASGCSIEIEETALPVRDSVRALCEMLGMDPLYVANEGKLVASVPEDCANDILSAMKEIPLGADARVIGRVLEGRRGEVTIRTELGSQRIVRMPSGEQLPRIC